VGGAPREKRAGRIVGEAGALARGASGVGGPRSLDRQDGRRRQDIQHGAERKFALAGEEAAAAGFREQSRVARVGERSVAQLDVADALRTDAGDVGGGAAGTDEVQAVEADRRVRPPGAVDERRGLDDRADRAPAHELERDIEPAGSGEVAQRGELVDRPRLVRVLDHDLHQGGDQFGRGLDVLLQRAHVASLRDRQRVDVVEAHAGRQERCADLAPQTRVRDDVVLQGDAERRDQPQAD